MKGFFTPAALEKLAPKKPLLVPRCENCKLYRGCKSPKMPPTGKGRRKVLIIGEAPGATEDATGKHLAGASGQLLRDALKEFGVELDYDCWKTNAIICKPPGTATPNNNQIDDCRPNLTATIQQFDPNVIIPLGQAAVRSLIGSIWKEDVGPMDRWAGWTIPNVAPNTWICPIWHPAYLLRNEKTPAMKVWWKRHLKAAFALAEEKPYNVLPDWQSKVVRIFDHEAAARNIRKMMTLGGTVAIDYETNMLKPDGANAEIVSCALCWEGKRTIAYPWHGDAIQATRELLQAESVAKLAFNFQFEDRWTNAILKTPVVNWLQDDMLYEHTQDQRQGTKSLKFLSFVRLGAPLYDDHIKPFLKAKTTRSVNRIREVDLRELLLYNGLDALLEWELFERTKRDGNGE